MPVTLTVRAEQAGQPRDEPSLTFDAPRVVIGRGASSDVRIPDASVSMRHATLSAHGAEYQIIDEGSTNGTFVGGVRLAPKAPRALRSGDMIRVGRVWLEVRVDQSAPTPDLASATRDLALAFVAQRMASRGNDTVPRVSIVEGPDLGTVLRLEDEGRVYVVGRGESCDLPLADADASREHLQIVRRGETVLVRDLRSKNGSTIGEQPVPTGRDAPWKQAVMVRVGASVLALEEPVADELGAIESVADEKMIAGETPEPPPSSSAPKEVAPPRSGRGAEAPIARLDKSVVTVQTRRRARIKTADIVIIGASLALIALSIAALVWFLK